MVKAKQDKELNTSAESAESNNEERKQSIILIPLAVLAVFSLSFIQLAASRSNPSPSSPARMSPADKDLPALPLIVQPEMPKLETTIETVLPPLTEPSTNPYAPTPNALEKKVGPSSTNAGNILQSVGNDLKNSKNDNLQAPRKNIRLEDAKF